MSRYGDLHTTTPVRDTLDDIRECFRKWEEQSGARFVWAEVRPLTEKRGHSPYGAAHIEYFRNGVQMPAARCSRFTTYAQNLRAVYSFLDMLRLADARGILGDLVEAGAALLALPAPAVPGAAPAAREAGPDDPYAVLEIAPTASAEVAEAAFRAKARTLHPDRPGGGDAEGFTRLTAAIEAVRRQRARA